MHCGAVSIYWIFTTSLRPFDILATPTLELWPEGATLSNYINIFKDQNFTQLS